MLPTTLAAAPAVIIMAPARWPCSGTHHRQANVVCSALPQAGQHVQSTLESLHKQAERRYAAVSVEARPVSFGEEEGMRTRLLRKELLVTDTVAPSVTYRPPVWQRFWSVHTLLAQTLPVTDDLRAGHPGVEMGRQRTPCQMWSSCCVQGLDRRRAERRPRVVQAPPSAAVIQQGRLRDGFSSSHGAGACQCARSRMRGRSLATGHGEGGETVAAVAAELETPDRGACALLHNDGAPAAKTCHQ